MSLQNVKKRIRELLNFRKITDPILNNTDHAYITEPREITHGRYLTLSRHSNDAGNGYYLLVYPTLYPANKVLPALFLDKAKHPENYQWCVYGKQPDSYNNPIILDQASKNEVVRQLSLIDVSKPLLLHLHFK